MKRGELYRVAHPTAQDPRKFRVFVVVSLCWTLPPHKLEALNQALHIALDLPD